MACLEIKFSFLKQIKMTSEIFDYCETQFMTEEELLNIDGGHDGTAYQIGHTIGQTMLVFGAIVGALSPFSRDS